MTAKFPAWRSGSESWTGCARLTPWPMCASPASIGGSRKPPNLCAKSKTWRKDMIHLKSDCLIFQTNCGQQVPCSAEWVTLELIGDAASLVDPDLIRHASAAVLYYFKHELRRQFVSVAEFA